MASCDMRLFGIRHHGSGSALRLIAALETFSPDALAIELPSDAAELVARLQITRHRPPIAFLHYDQDKPERAIYLPMAVFSPEYQALHYAWTNAVPVHCIDLPAAAGLCLSRSSESAKVHIQAEYANMVADPIGYLARQAGYRDGERWWESHFERWTDHEQLFALVCELMGALREQTGGMDDGETLLRETWMRRQLRALLASGCRRLAVVCGAWHAPVLSTAQLEVTPESPLPEIKTCAAAGAIIPWTYRHIALTPAYTAGVPNPMWHDVLFQHKDHAPAAFLSHAAQCFRKHGHEIAPSAVIEACRLAEHLALLREFPAPGIEELLEAASVLMPLKQTGFDPEDKLLYGEVTGYVELSRESLPFVQHFHNRLTALRMNRFWKDGPPPERLLDLREPPQLEVSRFLHACVVLDLAWALPVELDWNARGNFNERWMFHWNPGLEIELVELALLGNTLEQCCGARIRQKIGSAHALPDIALWLEHSLKAGLDELWPDLAAALDRICLQDHDLVQLARMIRPLQAILDYGSLHGTPTDFAARSLEGLLSHLVNRFSNHCIQLSQDRAQAMMEALLAVQYHLDKNGSGEWVSLWKGQLRSIAHHRESHPLLRGKCWSLLAGLKEIDEREFLEALQREFAPQIGVQQAAEWFEGFLHGQSPFFLLLPDALQCLNQWLAVQEEEDFLAFLPLMRRSFAQMKASERKRILQALEGHQSNQPSDWVWLLHSERMSIIDAGCHRRG